MPNDKPQSTLEIKAWEDLSIENFHITIRVPRDYVLNAEPARPNLSHMIDMPQFFGMLEDAICMKLGIEQPKTDKRGHNVSA